MRTQLNASPKGLYAGVSTGPGGTQDFRKDLGSCPTRRIGGGGGSTSYSGLTKQPWRIEMFPHPRPNLLPLPRPAPLAVTGGAGHDSPTFLGGSKGQSECSGACPWGPNGAPGLLHIRVLKIPIHLAPAPFLPWALSLIRPPASPSHLPPQTIDCRLHLKAAFPAMLIDAQLLQLIPVFAVKNAGEACKPYPSSLAVPHKSFLAPSSLEG